MAVNRLIGQAGFKHGLLLEMFLCCSFSNQDVLVHVAPALFAERQRQHRFELHETKWLASM